jgi:hypothetical protein
VADHDAGAERERDAAAVVAGRRQVALEPQRRRGDLQVRVVRQEGLAGDAPGPIDDPVVRALPRDREDGVAQERHPVGAALLRRLDQRRLRVEVGEQGAHDLGSAPLGDLGPEQLVVPVAGEPVRHEGRCCGPDLRRLVGRIQVGIGIEYLVLDRTGRHGLQPRLGAGLERVRHLQRAVVVVGGQALPDPVPPDGADESIDGNRQLAEQLGESSGAQAPHELDLEQALGRHHVALREEQVVEVPRVDVGDPPAVADDLHLLAEAGSSDLALDRRQPPPSVLLQALDPVAHGPLTVAAARPPGKQVVPPSPGAT